MPLRVELVGFYACSRPPLDILLLARENLDSQGCCYSLGDLALYCEYVLQFSVVALGPDVPVRAGFDHLDGYADTVSRFSDASFENGSCVQFLSDFADGFWLIIVLHDRGAGDHAQLSYLGHGGAEFLGHAIG